MKDHVYRAYMQGRFEDVLARMALAIKDLQNEPFDGRHQNLRTEAMRRRGRLLLVAADALSLADDLCPDCAKTTDEGELP